MADVKQGLVDIVVVYKVDRLTRSLADFAKIVEILDGHGASFVSVTQQFNTTTSMGRLTLNVLLSFAQFEREVTGERIRDKIAASKRKGMWMGGTTPFGYDVKDRQLVVNEGEAETVRTIYQRYVELGCVSALAIDLRDRGVVSKVKVSRRGQSHGGQPFGRGALYHLLQNRLYLGKVTHKGEAHAGQHPAIVPQSLWDQVQQGLASNRVLRRQPRATGGPQLLTGRIRDEQGNAMVPSHVRKANGQRYRYYVSRPLTTGKSDDGIGVGRISAGAIEALVIAEICRRLPTREAQRWEALTPDTQAQRVRELVASVIVRATDVDIGLSEEGIKVVAVRQPTSPTINVPVQLKPTAGGTSIVTLDGSLPRPGRIDRPLVRAIARANRWRELLEAGEARTAHDVARHEQCRVSYVQRLLPLAFLAPSLVEAILEGGQPAWCTLSELVGSPRPDSWVRHSDVG
jgi:hypothetical protein